MARAFVFPGQGSQSVGMGKDLAEVFVPAREVFEEVEETLKQNLQRLMFEGPEDELTLTENAQPALMAVSLAIVRVIEVEGGVPLERSCTLVAGHSLGEYSGLAAARAFSIGDAAGLLKARGRAMQRAVPVGQGAMAVIIGLDLDQASELAAEAADGEVCQLANDNAPGQVVLSGAKAAIERAMAMAAERGARRCIELPVSAPFHCALMAPAAEAMEAVLADIAIDPPVVPLIANVTAASVADPDTIRRVLVEQVTAMVRWRESVGAMIEADIDTIVEIGAGKVLAGLARRIEPELQALSLGTVADVEAFLENI